MQIGIGSGKVVGVYTNSESYRFMESIGVGTSKTATGNILGSPISYIRKGNTRYNFYNSNEQELFNIDDKMYATIFYDIHEGGNVTAMLLIDKNTEHSFEGYFGTPSVELMESFERQLFDLVNSARVRFGKTPFDYDEKLSEVARAHSTDMGGNNYFLHTNLSGQDPFKRMTQAGLTYRSAAENIACGQTSAIFAHEGWMNSSEHRSNILGNCKAIGVGIYLGGKQNAYYTQNFYTPY
jgi:uncharacterized protein YkwD